MYGFVVCIAGKSVRISGKPFEQADEFFIRLRRIHNIDTGITVTEIAHKYPAIRCYGQTERAIAATPGYSAVISFVGLICDVSEQRIHYVDTLVGGSPG